MDGVIVDTMPLHFASWADSLKKYIKGSIPTNLLEQVRGLNRQDSLNIFINSYELDLSEKEQEQILEKKNDHFHSSVAKLGAKDILPGIVQLIHWLKSKEILCAVGSSSKNTQVVLKQTELLDKFKAIADGNDQVQTKPAPDIFLLAAQRMEVLAERSLVIEDSLSGIEAAKSGGFITVGLGDKYKLNGADLILENLNPPNLVQLKEFILDA